ncbi:MAG TPA: DUF488 domain-containing protein [Anaerolineales bacterium]|nr:DUF488 domain-containing protein [Anaerolineales bacterium]
MKIYTIGFTQKSAETFFGLLKTHHIQRLVDIRLRPNGQLSGFARRDDLPYFIRELAAGCEYVHLSELAPTKEILDEYRKDKNWLRYVTRFELLMDEREIPTTLEPGDFETQTSCLLCSEATPEQCHRRLVAERLAAHWTGVEIVHL